MKKFVFNVTGLDNSRSPSFFSIELFTNWGKQQSGKPTAVFDNSFATKRRTAQPTKLTLDFERELQKLLEIVQVLMKGLFQFGQGQEGDRHAHAPTSKALVMGTTMPRTKLGTVVAVARRLVLNCSAATVTKMAQGHNWGRSN